MTDPMATPIKQEQMEIDGVGGDLVSDDQVPAFIKVERLQDSGINVADVLKLKAAGIGTAQVRDIATNTGTFRNFLSSVRSN